MVEQLGKEAEEDLQKKKMVVKHFKVDEHDTFQLNKNCRRSGKVESDGQHSAPTATWLRTKMMIDEHFFEVTVLGLGLVYYEY